MKYLFLTILIFTLGCSGEKYSGEAITCLKPEVDKPQCISDMLKSFRLIWLETTEQSLIGNHIGKIKKHNDKYYISTDRKELLIFDKNGFLINKISKIGNGPGEYIQLCDYDIFENDNIAILNANELIIYDKEGVYMKNIPLPFMPFNMKIINDDRILLYTSDEKYMIYEIDALGKIIKGKNKNTRSTQLGRNIAFITYGDSKIITQSGRSKDCTFYDIHTQEFDSAELVCDDILTATKEKFYMKIYGGNYLENLSHVKFIDGISGCNTHLLFGCGSLQSGFTIQVLDLKEKSIHHVISSNDINDITFTSSFFMEYACLAESKDCFITYAFPKDIQMGIEEHKEFMDNPNYRDIEKVFLSNKEELQDENPCLVEFIFK
ncbi:MAG: 6-bladed beta-propeller [Tannerellaceae bacterium]|nr:6-bladed beta-propeller [Tannerellaceae bacterium]